MYVPPTFVEDSSKVLRRTGVIIVTAFPGMIAGLYKE
jgi:hypothetical protein